MEVILESSALFREVRPETLSLAAKGRIVPYRRGQTVESGVLGLVLSGTVRAEGMGRTKAPVLSSFGPGDCFGMASLFGPACTDTRLRAASDCRVLLLSQETVEALLSDSAFARNYAAFLTEKLRFLNRKIAAFTAGTAEKTLLRYLLGLPARGSTVIVPMSFTRLAASLCFSRSSLYRALDDLEQQGLLTRNDDEITFSDREELIELYGGTI